MPCPQRTDRISGGQQPLWVKSTYSGEGGDCVEVAQLERTVGVRDSKSPAAAAVLTLQPEGWSDFLVNAKRGRYDLPSAVAKV
jgi:hypothetical protein